MKKTLVMGIFAISLLAACGGAKEEEGKEPTVCECITAKGAPPAGCDKVAGGMSEEEFAKAYDECKGNESPEE